eukprot:108613-Chlamydomonas_euryale.AAC.3
MGAVCAQVIPATEQPRVSVQQTRAATAAHASPRPQQACTRSAAPPHVGAALTGPHVRRLAGRQQARALSIRCVPMVAASPMRHVADVHERRGLGCLVAAPIAAPT